jgi:HAD superfamily hydrolase (TIGR01509 family)
MASIAKFLADREIALISLDLDDTLIDTDAGSAARLEAAVRRVYEVNPHIDPVRARAAFEAGMMANPVTVGRMPAFADALGVARDSEVAVAARDAYNAIILDVLEWVEGAEAILAPLRARYRLAIVTNGATDFQWPKVRKFGLQDLVDYVIVSGDYGVRKPDPAIFEHLLAKAGADAARTAHVGDSIHTDVAGARAAGLTAVWYPPRHREHDDPGEHTPHAVIETLADLLD